MEILRSMLHDFFAFSPVSLTDLCSFWYGLKDPFHSAQVSGQCFL